MGEMEEGNYRKALYSIKKDLEWKSLKGRNFAKTVVDEGGYNREEDVGYVNVPLKDSLERMLSYHTGVQRIIVRQRREGPTRKWEDIAIYYEVSNTNYLKEIYKKLL